MTFTATDHWLAIDYKLQGKFYNTNPLILDVLKKKTPPVAATSAPFDTELVAPDKTWTLPDGAQHIDTRVLGDAA
jgi:hypothetical protein